MRELFVVLNGTDHKWGLKQNPFPQMAEYGLASHCLALQELGGDPIPNADYIREVLKGHFNAEFIDLCVKQFKPGEYVRFRVWWEE